MTLWNRLIGKSLVVAAILASGSAQAGILGTDQCLDDASGLTTVCTAGDIGINSIKITKMIDGCISSTDTAIVNIDIDAVATVSRYDIGLFIDVGGGDATTTGNECVREALFPISADNTDLDTTSGIGPFRYIDTDQCGDMLAGETWTRTLVDSDLPAGSTTPMDIPLACSDLTGDGYVDFSWAVSWAVNAGAINCQSILDVTPSTKSKCNTNTTSSSDAGNPIPIGVPDLSLTISCTPSSLNVGDTTTCTVHYTNAATAGPADFIEFHIDYAADRGTISNIVQPAADDYQDNTSELTWQIGGTPTAGNISAGASGDLTFDFTMTSNGADVLQTVTAYFNNGVDSVTAQDLTDTDTITTLPVTIAYVYPQEIGYGIDVDFSTASETSNIGFNIYAIEKGTWTKLNDDIIPGALDSFEPRDYKVHFDLPAELSVKMIGIAGVDANGEEDFHGPFKINHESGSKITVAAVDWTKVHNQLKAKKKIKKLNADKTAVNLDVTNNALYQITHDDLLAAGVNLIGKKSEEIALSFRGEGVARHIDGADKRGRWTKASTIEFMGLAPQGNDALYLNANRYQLSFDSYLVAESPALEPSLLKTETFESNKKYSYSLPASDPFYDASVYAIGTTRPGNLTRSFDLPELPAGFTQLNLQLSAYSETRHHLVLSLNGTEIANERTEGWTSWPIELSVDNSLLKEGSNQLTLHLPGEEDTFDFIVYDKLVVTYNDGNPAEIRTPSIVLTEPIDKKALQLNKGTNYVIVSHPLFIGETLDRYIAQRESEGWKITLVNVEDIYASYGFGMATPEAIQLYLKDIEAQGVTHVQLVGAASYDYHDYLNLGSVSFIPSLYGYTGKHITFTPCDACLVLDEQNVPSLAIGRWPVRTLEGLEAVVNKTLAWESTGQSARHTALFIADETDKGMDFSKQMEQTAQKFANNGWEGLTGVYLDELIAEKDGNTDEAVNAARTEIAESLFEGASITSYSGHSSPSVWSFKGLLKQSDIPLIDNAGKTTLALPLACFATYADSPYINTMAHQLLAAGENGAVAVYGAATTSSYADNGVAAGKVIDGLLDGKTIGEAVQHTKQSLGSSYHDIIYNSNLLGDVTLQLQ